MNIKLNSRIALLYPANFAQTQQLEVILKANRTQLRTVGQDALDLTLATLAGYVQAPPAALELEGEVPLKSCIVFSGLPDGTLSRVLNQLREAAIALDYKAVLTPENRNWAFGRLIQEMQHEQAQSEDVRPHV